MPERRKVANTVSTDLFSIQVYNPSPSEETFDGETEFEKWAAVEVHNFNSIPEEMESFTLSRGLYSVFLHKGAAITAPQTFHYIFQEWLPGSNYLIDARPHFEILGEKYKNNDPDSEEEVWIPIKPK